MSEFNQFNPQSQVYSTDVAGLKSYITKVFVNMALALGVTAAVAFGCYLSLVNGGFFYQAVVNFPYLFWILFAGEMGIAIAFGAGITKFSTNTVKILMFVYAAITGVTFSILPISYGYGTIFTAFFYASALFISCAVIGHFTKVDLTKFSGLFMGALFAFVIMTLISMFIPALRDSLIMGYIGLVLFLGLTAWDMQKIKGYYYQLGEGTVKENIAVYSAFQLYLDFINIFLFILRILGSGRSRD